MLYATTRNKLDSFPARYVLNRERSEDGGLFVPFHSPKFTPEQVAQLEQIPFNECVARLLNAMFGTALTGWDVDFSVGRYPVRLKELVGRIVMGEIWHNPDWNFDAMARRLCRLLGAEKPQGWVSIGIRVAVLFAVYGELLRQKLILPGELLDVSVVSGDFSGPAAVWYARNWGLPIGSAVCCCNENNDLWTLICHGQFHTDSVSKPTCVPEADITLPSELERLVYGCGGIEEVEDYLECCRRGNSYFPGEQTLAAMREAIYVSVVSSQRLHQTVPGVYGTHGYMMGPATALAYSGLLDYRARKGHLRQALVISEKSPVCDSGFVSEALGIRPEKIKDLL